MFPMSIYTVGTLLYLATRSCSLAINLLSSLCNTFSEPRPNCPYCLVTGSTRKPPNGHPLKLLLLPANQDPVCTPLLLYRRSVTPDRDQ
ncbi:hypothetical protein F5Y14DRAFT_394934 [Nemania sp. NC0429]|nr:hypothetical protein F5Y14DRAFT_394934 [Nemania sp. NC0429]